MDPFTMMLLGGGIGGLMSLLGGGGGYGQIGSAADVKNVNPFTGTAWNLLTGNLGNYDYTQPFSYFTSQLAPELQQLSTSGEYAQGQLGLAGSQAGQVQRQLQQQYGGENALFSGAFGEALGSGVNQPYMQAIANITGQQSNLLGGLYGGALNQLGSMYQMPYSMMGQYGMPTFYEPNYGFKSSPFQNLLGGFGAGVGIGGAFGSIPGFGGGGETPSWVYGMGGYGGS